MDLFTTDEHDAVFARLANVVDCLAETNYPGSEHETTIDELGDAFAAYRAFLDEHST
jgi:hypothetical protein